MKNFEFVEVQDYAILKSREETHKPLLITEVQKTEKLITVLDYGCERVFSPNEIEEILLESEAYAML